MHVDDVAAACLFLMETYDELPMVNIGSGQELTIKELATLIGEITGYRGNITFDSSKPDGAPRKLMDSSRIHSLGWHHHISLREGIMATYPVFQDETLHQYPSNI
jgi:GDP-L-fucose synthase